MPISLSPEEQEFLKEELTFLYSHVSHEGMKSSYRKLLEWAHRGEVPDEYLEPLGKTLETGLETGRIRRVYSPEGERIALGLFSRTPLGRALEENLRTVNQALSFLQGHTIERLTFSLRGPGSFVASLQTDRALLSLSFDRHGPRIQSLEVGA
ncbi:hypothetical protein [Candidatus Methylacidithermus pantelleriae]|uniref:Uncharacterized protein n=1 Tax=Candidatus Methylacidithermus pantelleriae TaxID=2744239 RepID=A0A8J2BJB2_9BACT|nr:hypothetical protein [Candidatus Methylacidithermus pantelleriae]CAF0696328.1 conserved hypothetical protein [Candidatus Methylacidithermus pantelleriae]